jgi:hypothetical protein
VGWRQGVAASAVWTDDRCRSLTVSYAPGTEGPSEWRTTVSFGCGNSVLGTTHCRTSVVQAMGGTLSIRGVGFSGSDFARIRDGFDI